MKRALAVIALLLLAFPAAAQTVPTALGLDANGNVMQGVFRYGSQRVIPLGGGTVSIPPLNTGVLAIDIICTVACHVVQGISPVGATTNSMLVPANTVLRIRVTPNDGVSIIKDTTAGTVFITELQ